MKFKKEIKESLIIVPGMVLGFGILRIIEGVPFPFIGIKDVGVILGASFFYFIIKVIQSK